ncbi:MAG TPA: Maf family protein [Candidatus Angelobacter sp.]|nr:Maf family protein [Candidatus Angelobacter sp.]
MLAHRKLILASGSLRRQELLRGAGIEFEVYPADIPEDQKPGESPLEHGLRLAREKAEKVARQFPREFVLGGDTIVVVDEKVLGKPVDKQDAARMLRLLSGRSHLVITAVSLISPGRPAETRSLATKVYFRTLQEDEIQEYVNGGEPMDKAGAYAIQGGAARWVVRWEGDYSNVVGLPMPLVSEMLHTSGFLHS